VKALPAEFYDRPVLEVARELIGCTVEHRGVAGVIVETEAYHESEPACHAFAGLTPRTETLFGAPGRAYVYRSYGVHALLNAVCEPEGVGAAVLIRALAPLSGVEQMLARRKALPRPAVALNGRRGSEQLCSGPGKLTVSLGIGLADNGSCLSSGPIRISTRSRQWLEPDVVEGPRVGINRAVELPWRFSVAGSRYVSRPWPRAGAARAV